MADNGRTRDAKIEDVMCALDVNRRMVKKLIADGVIECDKLMNKPGQPLRFNIEETVEAYRAWGGGRAGGNGGKRPGAGRPKGSVVGRSTTAPKGGTSRSDAQTALLIRKAKLLDLEIAEKEGRLLVASEVRKVYTRAVTTASASLRAVPKTAAPQIVAELELPAEASIEIERIIRDAIAPVVHRLKAGILGGPEDE